MWKLDTGDKYISYKKLTYIFRCFKNTNKFYKGIPVFSLFRLKDFITELIFRGSKF